MTCWGGENHPSTAARIIKVETTLPEQVIPPKSAAGIISLPKHGKKVDHRKERFDQEERAYVHSKVM